MSQVNNTVTGVPHCHRGVMLSQVNHTVTQESCCHRTTMLSQVKHLLRGVGPEVAVILWSRCVKINFDRQLSFRSRSCRCVTLRCVRSRTSRFT